MLYPEVILEEIQKIKNLKGEVRGRAVQNFLLALSFQEGPPGLAKLKQRMAELNCWPEEFNDFQKIDPSAWYPLWHYFLPVVASVEIFGWDQAVIKKIGQNIMRASFLAKTFLKYLISLETAFKTVAEHWSKYFSLGDLQPVELSRVQKYIVLRLKDFPSYPLICLTVAGYMEGVAALVISGKNVHCQEAKCAGRGDPYDEFVISWE